MNSILEPQDRKLLDFSCPICQNNNYSVYLNGNLGNNPPVFGYKWTPEVRRSYRFVRCTDCRHIRASPRLADLYKYYVDNIDEIYISNNKLREFTANRTLEKIREYVPSGKLLDVGCATGDFLFVAGDAFEAEGLELSEWALKIAKSKGLNVRSELLSDIEHRKSYYDVVTLWGVIEHLENPFDEIVRIHEILKPGGVVCIWTGDVDSLLARFFGSSWWYVMGQHLQLFSRSSLDRLLIKANFRPLYRGIYPYVISLGYLGTSIGRYPVIGPFVRWALNLKYLKNLTFTLKLPDQIFNIYIKP